MKPLFWHWASEDALMHCVLWFQWSVGRTRSSMWTMAVLTTTLWRTTFKFRMMWTRSRFPGVLGTLTMWVLDDLQSPSFGSFLSNRSFLPLRNFFRIIGINKKAREWWVIIDVDTRWKLASRKRCWSSLEYIISITVARRQWCPCQQLTRSVW